MAVRRVRLASQESEALPKRDERDRDLREGVEFI